MFTERETPTERYCRKIQVVLSDYQEEIEQIKQMRIEALSGEKLTAEQALSIRNIADSMIVDARSRRDDNAKKLQKQLKEELKQEFGKLDI